MFMVRIHTTIPRVAGRLKLLPKRLEKKSERIGIAWAKAVRKSAKLRAPKDTGTLANSIEFRQIMNKTGKYSVKRWEIGIFGKAYRYGRYIERGWTPHWIPIEYLEQHRENPGQKGQYVENPSGWVLSHPFNTRTGFISSALLATKRNLPNILKRELGKL